MCDKPNCDHDDTFFQDQNRMIEQHGFSVLCVHGDDDGPGFIYTIGLSEKGMSDLIFIGSSSQQAAAYLMGAAHSQLEGNSLTMGRIDPIWNKDESEETVTQKLEKAGALVNGFPVPMVLMEANDRLTSHAFSTARRLEAIESKRKASLAQVIMPDMEGRFPWEAGYDWLDQNVNAAPAGTHGV